MELRYEPLLYENAAKLSLSLSLSLGVFDSTVPSHCS